MEISETKRLEIIAVTKMATEFGIKLPEFVSVSVNTLGSCMSPVSMILTGVIVAGINIKKVIKFLTLSLN